MNLDFFVAKLRFVNKRQVSFPAFGAANLIRGQFGRELFEERHDLYERLFSPPRRLDGPSGLQDPPRPYVLRTRHLDGRRYSPGEGLEFEVNVFDLSLLDAFTGHPVVRHTLDLNSGPAASLLRIGFVSPTELKGATQPNFGALLARLRDRVSGLRGLYGAGPLEIDFRAFGERARAVAMPRCAIHDVDRMRISQRTGQRHSIGGFVGEAEYQAAPECSLSEFLPFLQAGAFTGVGRQTVWGKGELQVTVLR